ncbi:winged helix-turn-helix transcriptional regulator [Nakamurella flava]|nr:helix-turn-helix domain-containing protein [Nakamurella flava]
MPVTDTTTAPTVWARMAADVLGPEGATGGSADDGRDALFGVGCPSRRLLDTITSRWGVLVVLALSERSMRWGELHRFIDGISEKMLAQTLRALESEGLVHRASAGTVPPRVDYSLTDRGRQAAAVVEPLVRWVGQDTVATARRADAS